MVVWQTLRACSSTLSSHSASTRSASGRPSSQARWRSRTSWTWRSHRSARPTRRSVSAAFTPPQPLWPTTMMWRTRSMSTANCTTDSALRSVGTTTLATLRCTNSSPGSRPTSSLAGTRLSAQPIHRYCGVCCLSRREKKPGSRCSISPAHCRLLSQSSWSAVVLGFGSVRNLVGLRRRGGAAGGWRWRTPRRGPARAGGGSGPRAARSRPGSPRCPRAAAAAARGGRAALRGRR